MKKIILVLLFVSLMVLPAFAYDFEFAKEKISVDAKIGMGLFTENKIDDFDITKKADEDNKDNIDSAFDMKIPVIISIDGYYRLFQNLNVGIGANFIFNNDTKADENLEVGFTNIYLAFKPEVQLDSNIFNSIYGIGQFGLALPREDSKYTSDVKCGIYWAAGFGTELKYGIILEAIYAMDIYNMKIYDEKFTNKYSSIFLNIGYKYQF